MTVEKKIIIGGCMLAAGAVIVFWPTDDQVVSEASEQLPTVMVTSAGEYTGQTTVSLIGTVRAFSEAAITAEQPGRVTSVPVTLGQSVQAGQIVLTLENASQRAAVLQAEGVYEAAIAAAAQDEIGTTQAQADIEAARDNLRSQINTAYSTVNGLIFSNIDQFFSNPTGTVPGLRISGRGNTENLNDIRVRYQALLPAWKADIDSLAAGSEIIDSAELARRNISQTIVLVDLFLAVFSDQGNTSRYTEAELAQFANTFSSLRNSLVQTDATIDSAMSRLNAAENALERAQISASGSQNSVADAQIKQALGSLRAAQANLAKTVLRSPIAGTVNSLLVKQGDFIGAQQQVALVANNDALEIVTAIGEQEREAFAIGDVVTIEDDLSGTVTQIAPAVSPGTGKIEVRIAAESVDLKNGDTVTITRQATTSTDSRVFVPLSAVKFQQTDGEVFLVADGILEARSVTLGVVRGGAVEILSGLDNSNEFVVDARGLQAGTAVEISN